MNRISDNISVGALSIDLYHLFVGAGFFGLSDEIESECVSMVL
ncbi:MAG: hypothetical protein V7731_03105 [Amphritea sp.]